MNAFVRLGQFLEGMATDDWQWHAIDTGIAPGSADEGLKKCLGRHIHDPRIEKSLIAGCYDGGYADYLRRFNIKPYLRLSRLITWVACKSTHPSYLSLPFQTMRPEGLFETSKRYDRNPTPHPPLIKGDSGSSRDGTSCSGTSAMLHRRTKNSSFQHRARSFSSSFTQQTTGEHTATRLLEVEASVMTSGRGKGCPSCFSISAGPLGNLACKLAQSS